MKIFHLLQLKEIISVGRLFLEQALIHLQCSPLQFVLRSKFYYIQ